MSEHEQRSEGPPDQGPVEGRPAVPDVMQFALAPQTPATGRRLTIVVVAASALIVVLVVVLFGLAGGDRGMADVFPADTVAYVHISNLQRVYEDMEESGLLRVLEDIVEQEAERDIARAVRDLIRKCEKLRSVSWAFVGMADEEVPDLIFAVDVGAGRDLKDWLPEELASKLDDEGTYQGVQLYCPGEEGSRRRREGLPFLAAVDGKVLVAMSRSRLEDTIRAMKKGNDSCLADHERYEEATRGLRGKDVLAYVDVPRVLTLIRAAISKYDREEFETVVDVAELRSLRGVAMGSDLYGQTSVIQAVLDEDSEAHALLDGAGGRTGVAECLPEDTVFFVSFNVGDARKTWDRLKEHIASRLVRAGEFRSSGEFYDELREEEEQMGVRIDDVAEELDGEFGFFMAGGLDEDYLGVFARVKSERRASELLEGFIREAFSAEDWTTREVEGVEVRTAGSGRRDRFCWAFVDDYLFAAPRVETVESVVRAEDSGDTLDDAEAYSGAARHLARTSICSAYVNVEELFEGMMAAMPPDARDMVSRMEDQMEGLGIGATLSLDGEMLRLDLAQSKKPSPRDSWRVVKELLETAVLREGRPARVRRARAPAPWAREKTKKAMPKRPAKRAPDWGSETK